MQTARFILNKLMPLWLIVFGVVAYLVPSPFTALTPYATYMLGGVIMLMSLKLTVGSLGEVFARPKAVIGGFVIALPLLLIVLPSLLRWMYRRKPSPGAAGVDAAL